MSSRDPLQPWVLFGGLGVLCAVAFVVTDAPGVQAALQGLMSVASAILLLRARRRRHMARAERVSRLIVAAFAAYFVATIARVILTLTTPDGSTVSVSPLLEPLFFSSYVLLALLLWRLGSRSTGPNRRDGLDTLIVAGAVAPALWVFLLAPSLATGRTSLELVTLALHPIGVFVLCGLTIRLAFVTQCTTGAHVLIRGWIGLELVADIVSLRQWVNGSFTFGAPWQAMWILSAACIGAFALHPRNTQLLERRTTTGVNGTSRLYVLGGSLSIPILTVAHESARTHDHSHLIPAGLTLVLVGLVIRRLSGLMVDNVAQQVVHDRLHRLTESLAHEALHDPLSGLGNRVLFAEHADLALSRRPTAASRGATIVLLDLDDFKTINDTFGHEAGDRVLIEVSRRLERVGRHGEGVFRLGGDEFAFVLGDALLEDALRLADRVATVLAAPFDLGPRIVRPRASIGVAIALDGQDRTALLAEADMAMYESKRRTAAGPSVFDPIHHRETLKRHQMERDLRDAVEQGQLRLLYQPVVNLSTNDIVGVEALVRWEHPTHGTLSPVDFISLAEASGAILDIGDWVLDESIRQLQRWDETNSNRRLHVNVNVSPRQLTDPGFVERTTDVLRRTGIAPCRITLEITEAAFGPEIDTMIGRLCALKALGVRLAIDDFGTGYSSLSKLRRLPIDVIKIDKSFVDGIATEPEEWALTTAIIRLAASLRKTTVAEGIETGGQLAHLLSLNVEFGQGYLFARPLVAGGITELVSSPPGAVFLVPSLDPPA